MKYALSAVAAALLATTAMSSASAADLPRRSAAIAPAPVYVAPVFTWAGFYAGVQGGYAWQNAKARAYDATGALLLSANEKPKGPFGGVHAGYNWQSGALVYGLEVDGEFGSIRRNDAAVFGLRVRDDYRASLRGRLGYGFDRALVYVTGGAALGQEKFSVVNAGTVFSSDKARFGWTLGAGVEYAITNAWSVRAEYRYTDLGTANVRGFPAAFAPADHVRVRMTDQAVRVGLSYHFGAPASAIVAKY